MADETKVVGGMCPDCGEPVDYWFMDAYTHSPYFKWTCGSDTNGNRSDACRIRCLERETQRLKSALLKYGVHAFDCWVRQVGVQESGVSCNCGWEELLDELEGRNG